MREGDWSDETQEALRNSIEQFADDFGYDLDEEGHPLTEDSEMQEDERRRGSRDESDDEDSGDSEREDEEETVGAEA
jgi:F-type H+-transporting ATPase subunit alpha